MHPGDQWVKGTASFCELVFPLQHNEYLVYVDGWCIVEKFCFFITQCSILQELSTGQHQWPDGVSEARRDSPGAERRSWYPCDSRRWQRWHQHPMVAAINVARQWFIAVFRSSDLSSLPLVWFWGIFRVWCDKSEVSSLEKSRKISVSA